MAAFVFPGLATRVLFGVGTVLDLQAEVERLGMRHALVITGKQQSDLGKSISAQLGALTFNQAAMHTPLQVTDAAMAMVQRHAIDGLIAIGGGSAIGLGKAIAFRTDLAQIAVPTTYAGSEMTPILGETSGGVKTTIRDPRIQPETVIYDPDLTRTLPQRLVAASGINAMAHAVEALYAKDGNPLTALMAEEGIRLLGSSLPAVETARSEALLGAWLCGAALGATGMALHHKLCHVLGGSFALPHAETHTVVLPHVTAFNADAAPDAMRSIACALSVDVAAQGIFDLARRLGAPSSLKELGLREEDLDRAASLTIATSSWNPRPLTWDGVRTLLDDAFHGRRPRAYTHNSQSE